MKLQCSCGAKYAFDARPEMLMHPVKFICPSCGLDASDFVNELIRQEFGAQVLPQPGTPDAPPPPPPPPPPRASGLRVAHETAPAVQPQEAVPVSKFCARHRERATAQCFVCHKPICAKCLALFGYFCSPLCKGKAEAQNLKVPVYAGQRDVVEAQFWHKTGLIAGSIGLLIALFLGLWTSYAWYFSVPHTYLSVRFEDTDRGYYGNAQLEGKDRDQLVFLHGGTLARYDLKTKKPVWSQELITQQQIDDFVKAEDEEQAKANEGFGLHSHRSQDDIVRSARQALQEALTLHVFGQNIWVEKEGKLTRYDWDTGKVVKEVTLPEAEGQLVESGDELQIIGPKTVTHISLATGDTRMEEFGPAGAKTIVLAENDAGGGLAAGANGLPMNPQQVEAQAQNMKLQGKIALPALLANAQHEHQLEQALKDDAQRPQPKNSKSLPDNAELFQLVPGPAGFVEFSSRLLEERTVTRSAMKAPPKKSVIDSGNINAANEMTAVNEQLNEMQRNAGGDTVTEDVSRYQVTVHLPGTESSSDWSGEVEGSPQLFVLKTVNVIAAGKTVIVLDQNNKKLWQTTLTYPVSGGEGGLRSFSREESPYGEGPCVEHGDSLYVFDQAVLAAFDLTSGSARWRLPTVGVVGLFFDNQGDLYVNTTTGNPDEVKYSRQIDVTRKTEDVVMKVEAKTGKTLWTAKPGGFVSYVSGKFLYVIASYDPNPTDEDQMNDMTASMQLPAYLRITRIRPADGKIMWDYYDRNRCPVNWNFDGNSIQLIFKREVQVLRFLTL